MLDLDLNRIIENLIILLVGGIGGWMLTRLLKHGKDINVAFKRIRDLEGAKNECNSCKTVQNHASQTTN